MNDGWQTKGGQRWSRRERDRVAERFRSHVRTPSNQRGRIHREGCHYHPDVPGEAHHVDYTKPFLVAWLCYSCHRKADHGGIDITKKMLWDYSSLILVRPGLVGNKNAIRDSHLPAEGPSMYGNNNVLEMPKPEESETECDKCPEEQCNGCQHMPASTGTDGIPF